MKDKKQQKNKNIEKTKELVKTIEIDRNSQLDKTKEISFDLDNTSTLDISFVDKPNKKLYIFILILIIILLCVISFFLYYKLKERPKKDENVEEEEVIPTDKTIQLDTYGKKLEEVILNNLNQNKTILTFDEANKLIEIDYDISCQIHEVYKDGKIYLSRCFIDGKRVDNSYGVRQESEIEFDKYRMAKVYINVNDEHKKTFIMPSDIENYKEIIFKCNEKCSDFSMFGDTDYVLYKDKGGLLKIKDLYSSNKLLEEIKYNRIYPIYKTESNKFDNEYIVLEKNNKWAIYNYKTSKPLVGFIYDNLNLKLDKEENKNDYIFTINDNLLPVSKNKKMGIIEYKTGKEIVPIEFDSLTKSSNLILASDSTNNKNILYDESGNKYLKDKYSNIYGIVNGSYLLVQNEKDVQLIKIDGELLYNYGKVENIGKINFQTNLDNIYIYNLQKKNSNMCLEFVYDNSNKLGSYKEVDC